MARRVFLHIGAPKTGSTYVQNVLWDNWAPLRDAGVLLPATLAAHDQAMTDLRGVPWREPDATWTWDRLVAIASAWPGDAVISSEGLGAATRDQAARAVRSLQPAEVHVVVAGRDLWRTLPSMWQQSIRGRSVWRFEDFLRAVEEGRCETFWENHTAGRMLCRWGDLVPAQQRHLVTVPPPGTAPDVLWRRFAGIIGIPDGLCDLPAPASNPSLGAAETELLRRINQALGDRYPLRLPYRTVVHRHLIDAVLKHLPNDRRFGVSLDGAEWVSRFAEQQIDQLRAYPCHIVGDLDELRPVTTAAGGSPDDISDERLVETAIDTIVGLLAHADALTRSPDGRSPGVFAQLRRRAAGGVRRRLGRARPGAAVPPSVPPHPSVSR